MFRSARQWRGQIFEQESAAVNGFHLGFKTNYGLMIKFEIRLEKQQPNKFMKKTSIFFTALCLFALAISLVAQTSDSMKQALGSITSADILRHTKTLASEEFEGRGPGRGGEELAGNYLVSA